MDHGLPRGIVTQPEEIITTFQSYGNAMTLGQMGSYPWFYEFRSRKVEINKNDPIYQIRLVKRGEKASDNLYVLEKKPRPGELL
jgi:hypothetical protein